MAAPASSPAGNFDRRWFLRVTVGAAGAVMVQRATPALARSSETAADGGADVAIVWFDLASDLVRTTPGFTPPVASRVFGYAGVALYEAVLAGWPGHRSLAGQLSGLTRPPSSAGESGSLDWLLVANAALATALRGLFPPSAARDAAINALERLFLDSRAVTPDVALRSQLHGQAVAAHVLAWASTDGGHKGYVRNFPADYVPPTGPGLWVPTPPGFLPALQPYWGRNRTMIPGLLTSLFVRPPLSYSTHPRSRFYVEAREVYRTVNSLTPEQRAIAEFWSDDPGLTATPPGHSISILTQVLAARRADLRLAAEAYARLGIAISDAFVSCWATKYQHNLLRPITYIRAVIDPSWGNPLPLTTPPFPEYTSGHSLQSGAMATTLTDLFGQVEFTDHTHDERGLPPRQFRSFWDAAAEAAISRLYGGIHYRRAIEKGLLQGAQIGHAVNRLRFSTRG